MNSACKGFSFHSKFSRNVLNEIHTKNYNIASMTWIQTKGSFYYKYSHEYSMVFVWHFQKWSSFYLLCWFSTQVWGREHDTRIENRNLRILHKWILDENNSEHLIYPILYNSKKKVSSNQCQCLSYSWNCLMHCNWKHSINSFLNCVGHIYTEIFNIFFSFWNANITRLLKQNYSLGGIFIRTL